MALRSERLGLVPGQRLDLARVLHGGAGTLVVGEQRERLGLAGFDRRQRLVGVARPRRIIADTARQAVDPPPQLEILDRLAQRYDGLAAIEAPKRLDWQSGPPVRSPFEAHDAGLQGVDALAFDGAGEC